MPCRKRNRSGSRAKRTDSVRCMLLGVASRRVDGGGVRRYREPGESLWFLLECWRRLRALGTRRCARLALPSPLRRKRSMSSPLAERGCRLRRAAHVLDANPTSWTSAKSHGHPSRWFGRCWRGRASRRPRNVRRAGPLLDDVVLDEVRIEPRHSGTKRWKRTRIPISQSSSVWSHKRTSACGWRALVLRALTVPRLLGAHVRVSVSAALRHAPHGFSCSPRRARADSELVSVFTTVLAGVAIPEADDERMTSAIQTAFEQAPYLADGGAP